MCYHRFTETLVYGNSDELEIKDFSLVILKTFIHVSITQSKHEKLFYYPNRKLAININVT